MYGQGVGSFNAGSVGMGQGGGLPVQLTFAGDVNEQRGYATAFFGAGGQVGGVVASQVVRDLLQRFGLPNEYLAKIWSLSSITPNPANPGLSLPEFLLACHLCRLSVTSRQPPPDYLPDNYRAEVVQAVFNLRGGQQQQQQQPQQSFQLPQQQFANQQQQFMNTQSIARPAMQPQPIMSPQAAGPSFAQFQQPQQPQSFSQPQSFQQSQSFANQSQSFTAPSSASPWTITPADRATFDQVFRAWDPRNTGYVLGDTAREIFGQSGLAANVLARIWELSALSDPARLNATEFAIAMQLVNKKIQGIDLPPSLPPELVPPAKRTLDEAVEAAKRAGMAAASAPNNQQGRLGASSGFPLSASGSAMGLSTGGLPAASTSILPQPTGASSVAAGGFEERFPDVDTLLADAGVGGGTPGLQTPRATQGSQFTPTMVGSAGHGGISAPSTPSTAYSAPPPPVPSVQSAPAPSTRAIDLLSQIPSLQSQLTTLSSRRSTLLSSITDLSSSVAVLASSVKPQGTSRIAELAGRGEFDKVASVAAAVKRAGEIEGEARDAEERSRKEVRRAEDSERDARDAGREREDKEREKERGGRIGTTFGTGAAATVPPPFGSSLGTPSVATVPPPFGTATGTPSGATVPPPFGSTSKAYPFPTSTPLPPTSPSAASIIAATAPAPPSPAPLSPPTSPPPASSSTPGTAGSSASDYARRIMEQAQAAVRDAQARAQENERRAREAVEAVRSGRVGIGASAAAGAAGVPPSEAGKVGNVVRTGPAPAPPSAPTGSEKPKPRGAPPPPKPKPMGLGAKPNERSGTPPPPVTAPVANAHWEPAPPLSQPTVPAVAPPFIPAFVPQPPATVAKVPLVRPPSPDSWADEDAPPKKVDPPRGTSPAPLSPVAAQSSRTTSPAPDGAVGGDSSKVPARASLDVDEIAKQARAAREAAKQREADAVEKEKATGGISFATGNPFAFQNRSRSASTTGAKEQKPRSRSPSKVGKEPQVVAGSSNPFGTFPPGNPFGALGAGSGGAPNPFGALPTGNDTFSGGLGGNPFGGLSNRRPSDADWLGTPASEMDRPISSSVLSDAAKAEEEKDIVKSGQAGARADFKSEIAAARAGTGVDDAKKKLQGLFGPGPVDSKDKEPPPKPIKIDVKPDDDDGWGKPNVTKEVLEAVKTGKDLGLPSMADRRAMLEKRFSDVGTAPATSAPVTTSKTESSRPWENKQPPVSPPTPPPLASGTVPPPPPPPPPGPISGAATPRSGSSEDMFGGSKAPPKSLPSPLIARISAQVEEAQQRAAKIDEAQIPLPQEPSPQVVTEDRVGSTETQSSAWGDEGTSSPVASSLPTVKFHVRTLYQYDHTQPDDLSFDADCVIAVEKEEGEWMFGKIAEGKEGVGREGWFPITYIEKIYNYVPGSLSQNPVTPTVTITTPKFEANAVVLYDYEATRDDEMTVYTGELLGIINKDDPEWWMAERLEDETHKPTGKVGDRGVVPNTYVELLQTGVQDFEKRGGGGFSGGKTWIPEAQTNGRSDDMPSSWDLADANPFGSSEDTPWVVDQEPAVVSEPPRKQLSGRASAAGPKIAPPVGPSPAALARTRQGALDSAGKRNSAGPTLIGDSVFSPTGSPESSRRSSVPVPTSAQLAVNLNGSAEGLSLSRSGSREISPGKEYETWSSRMDPQILEGLSQEERKRQEAIYELIRTEQTYVQDLQMIVEDFYNPMQNFMKAEDLKQIFSNIGEILEKNAIYMSDILQVQQEDGMVVQVIGPAFVKHSKSLERYKDYCAVQMNASKFLQKRRQEDAQLGDFLKARQRDPKFRGLDLSSYLLEPMQRLTRYPLLLRKVIHYTPKSHPDHDSLLIALNLAEKALEDVNERAKEVDNRQKMDEISNLVDFEKADERVDLYASTRLVGKRQFVYEGPLTKAKSNRKLYAYLFNDLLLLVERKSATAISVAKNSYQYWMYRKPLPLSECAAREIPPNARLPFSVDEACFQVVHIEDIITFRAPSVSNKRTWLNHLDRQVTNLSAATKTLERQKQQRASTFNATGTLKLSILEGTQIVQADMAKLEVFCRVEVGHQTIKTKIVRDPSLKFNQTLMFSVEDLDESVRITVLNYDKYSQDEVLGVAELRLDFLEYYNEKETERMQLQLKNAARGAMLFVTMQYVRHV